MEPLGTTDTMEPLAHTIFNMDLQQMLTNKNRRKQSTTVSLLQGCRPEGGEQLPSWKGRKLHLDPFPLWDKIFKLLEEGQPL